MNHECVNPDIFAVIHAIIVLLTTVTTAATTWLVMDKKREQRNGHNGNGEEHGNRDLHLRNGDAPHDNRESGRRH